MVHAVFFGEGNLFVAAIDAAGAGVNQVTHGVVPTALEDIHEAHEVGIHVGERILNGIAHARLRAQVDDTVEPFACEEFRKGLAVGQVAQNEAERAADPFKLGEPCILQLPGIIVVDVVQSDNRVAPAQQVTHYVRADKTGRSGNQYLHVPKIQKKCWLFTSIFLVAPTRFELVFQP